MATRIVEEQKYTVGWLCALPIELAAARMLLDQKPENLHHDGVEYTLGSIASHNVVIGCLPAGQVGIGSAATVATKMRANFPNLRFGLMVGVGGGVPGKKGVRLGDVVVSHPNASHGGVIQYTFGKSLPGGFIHTGFLNTPPQSLLQAVANLRARHIEKNNNVSPYLAISKSRADFRRPESEDILFMPTYDHIKDEETCGKCDKSKKVDLGSRGHNNPVIHYGTIASGDCVMKNGEERDLISSKFDGVLCFEMEAAGLMNSWPCLVIRGICDYADSHKNKEWQPYAAGVAAGFAKELLVGISPAVANEGRTVNSVIKDHEEIQNFSKGLSTLFHNPPALMSIANLKTWAGERVKKTCEWILASKEYESFLLERRPHIFWIHGGLGKGKTTLAHFLTEKLGSMLCPDEIILYFFCDRSNRKLNSATSVLAGLIWRLLFLRPALFKKIPTTYRDIDISTLNERELWYIFVRLIHDAEAKTRYCVIDGLDECDETSEIFMESCIVDEAKIHENLPKFLITSKKLPRSRASKLLDLESSACVSLIEQDVHTFICDRIHHAVKDFPDLEAFQERLIYELKRLSEGTFLGAALFVKELERNLWKRDLTEVVGALHAVPSGFSQYSRRMLDNVPPDPIIKDIFRWVALAMRPLTLEELGAAIGSPRGSFTSEQVVKGYVRRCFPFLETRSDSIYFFHSSAANYICHLLDRSSLFAIDVQDGHLQIAKRCLEYICKELSQKTVKNTLPPFLYYAALYFPDHARASSPEIADILDSDKDFFSSGSRIREDWLNMYLSLSQSAWVFPRIPVLHMASCFGIVPIVTKLLEKESSLPRLARGIDKRDDRGQTALQLALRHGHDDVVKELLVRGADSNSKYDRIALNTVYIQGNGNVVRQLLGPSDASRHYGFFALHWACYHGYGAAAELLLNYGAEINAVTGCFVFNFAYITGDGNLVSQSQHYRSTISGLRRKTEAGFSALHLAALRGHEAIVKLLLDRGADVNAKFRFPAVQLTFLRGNNNMVEQSLEIGAGSNYTLVQGHQNMINQNSQLLEGGACPNSIQVQGHQNKVTQGSRNTVTRQIWKAITQSQNDEAAMGAEDSCTAIYLAALNGHKTVVELLLHRGAGANKAPPTGILDMPMQSVPEPSTLIDKSLEIQRLSRPNLPLDTIDPFLVLSFLALHL